MASADAVAGLYRQLRGRHRMTIDPTMQAVFASLFAMATGAVGWLVTKVWTGRDEAHSKLYAMLEKQFDDAARRKDLFDNLGRTIDGNTQAVKELRDTFNREVQAVRTDIQRIRPMP